MSSIILNPFQLLELNIISAQDLAKVTRSMRTYAVAWVHPDRKLSTRIDTQGRNCPRWNDKFVFRINDEFLSSDTSAIIIEIYAVHWFKDALVGRVRVLVSNLVPPPSRPFRHQRPQGLQFAALQVRRPSGRPQGILNIGVAVLDSAMRSMPLQQELSPPVVGYHNLIGQQSPNTRNQNDHPEQQQQQPNQQQDQQQKQIQPAATAKPVLRRTKSDTSSMHGVRTLKRVVSFSEKPNSVINASEATSSAQGKSKKGSSSAPSSMVNASVSALPLASASPGRKSKKGKVSGNLAKTGSEVATITPSRPPTNSSKFVQKAEIATASKKWVPKPEAAAPSPINPLTNRAKWVSSAAASPINPSPNKLKQGPANNIIEQPAPKNLAISSGSGAPNKSRKPYIIDSELGPTPSEVLALKYQMQPNDRESTIAGGGWSLVESEEGLQTKLARWRMELPPVYDRRYTSSLVTSSGNSKTIGSRALSKRRQSRRQTDGVASGGGGLFSCVGNICGCQCSIVCGNGSPALLE